MLADKVFRVGLTKNMFFFFWLDCESSCILVLVGMVSVRKEWVSREACDAYYLSVPRWPVYYALHSDFTYFGYK